MQDYINNARLALKKFREIKNMIEESAEIMNDFKCSLSLQGTMHGQRHESLDEDDLSKAMWMQFISELPYCTEAQRYTIERTYATKSTFWESSDEIAWLQGQEAIRMRMTEQLEEVKDWLKAGMYYEKRQRFEMNHTTIPQTQKLYCTPNVSGGRDANWWNNSRAHSLFNSLDAVLHWMTGAPQPEQLAGDKILKQVDRDIVTHGTLKNKVFLGEFFILKMTVSGNSTLTLRTGAHALLTKKDLTTLAAEVQTVEAAEVQTVEAAEVQTVEAPAEQPKQTEDLEIIVQFTKQDGLLVYGDTKPLRKIIKAHGLRWDDSAKHWYIYGSRRKDDLEAWEKSRVERMVLALRGTGCKVRIKIAA